MQGATTATAFLVAAWVEMLGSLASRNKRLWIRLGNLESKLLFQEIERRLIQTPIYVSGLARFGTMILLEILFHHPAFTTHRYKYFPLDFMPHWRKWLLHRMPARDVRPVERAHCTASS